MKLAVCTLLMAVITAVIAQDLKSKDSSPLKAEDKVDFLLVQRDWISIQNQYQTSFKKEPAVVAYESKLVVMQKSCQDAKLRFDEQKVSCIAVPDPPKSSK